MILGGLNELESYFFSIGVILEMAFGLFLKHHLYLECLISIQELGD